MHNHPLDRFSILEQITWALKYYITEKKDKVYCLLDIFGVTMPLVYGEGRVKVLRKLESEYNTENSLLSRVFLLEKYLLIITLRDNKFKKYLKC